MKSNNKNLTKKNKSIKEQYKFHNKSLMMSKK